MENESGSSVREVFLEAAEMDDPETRAAYLNKVCAGDGSLRRRVEALLAAEAQAGGPPPEPLPPAQTSSDPALGSRVGHYRLLQQIGEGGCGVVFMAEQEQPVRRKVALKVIKLGMDTRQVVARFEAERQALALMDHPNIAKVLDAGTTERHLTRSAGILSPTGGERSGEGAFGAGRPYFVMELVHGIKITDYCDQHQLPTRQRLDLFIQVCHAVQHAHQKGIIHRDLKPSNILVTELDGEPLPKIIDFGIAKAVEGRLTDQTLFTAFEQFIGTPAYMSPEQAALTATDIDTRSDIYSLGVLLYELLTGKTPFETRALLASGLDAMRQTIREVQPVRPSTRLRQTGAISRHGSALGPRPSPLATDLDWIVMKCLEKDRTRRYETANGLAMDLKRHLTNEAVIARPPSKLYEFQRTVRRHKVGFAATAAIIIVLAAGVLVSTWQTVRATRAKASEFIQRQKAEANEEQAVAAQAAEIQLRRQTQTKELAARQRAYASDMNMAVRALNDNHLGQALDLLYRQRPKAGQKDLRGWEWRFLWQQTRSDALFTLCRINGEVSSLAASPDGRWLAVGAEHEGGVAVWDLQTRQEVAHLATNEEMAYAVFSPTDPLLAFAGNKIPASGPPQPILYLWNTTNRQKVGEIPLDGLCVGLAFSRDGRTLVSSTRHGHVGNEGLKESVIRKRNLVSSTRYGQITLWRMPDGTKVASYPSEQAAQLGPGFAATTDLSLAAYWSIGARIHVVDLRTGKALWTAVAGQQFITALAFSPDGKTLASAVGFGDSDIRLWDAATGKDIGRLEGQGWVSSLVFWPDGGKLASSSADQTIRIWDVASRKCLDVLRGSRSQVWQLALLPDHKTLVSGNKNGAVLFWDASITHPRQPGITIPANVSAWCFTPDSQSVLTVDQQGHVARWSGPNFQQPEPLMTLPTGTRLSPAFSEDGRYLVVASTNGVVQVWNVTRRVLRCQWTNSAGEVEPIQFFADGDKLLTRAEHGNLIQERDLTAGLELQSWAAPRRFNGCRVSPDGLMTAAVGEEGGFLRRLSGPNSANRSLDILEADTLAFSPDGRQLAVTSHLGYFRVWNAASGREEVTLAPAISGVAFSRDGKRLAIDTGAGVGLWDTDSWQHVLTLRGLGAGYDFGYIAFSPDDNILGALNYVGTLDLWRAPSWEEITAQEKAEAGMAHPPQ